MSDNYELKIDPTGAESGAKRIEKSFEKIAKASEGMEARVKSSFSSAAAILKAFNSVGALPSSLSRDVKNLSSAMSGFKGPSLAAVNSTLQLLRGLKSIGVFQVARGSSITPLLTAMSGYKGPSASSARNTSLLLRSLQGFTGGPKISGGLTGFLGALAGYRGPTEVSVRNTRAFLSALSKFTPPAGVNVSINQFRKLAEQIDQAARSLRALNSGAKGKVGFAAPSKDEISRLSDYTRQHGALQTALLRTQTAFHALGGVLGAKFIVDAANQVVRIRAQLEAATGSVEQSRVQFEFLRKETERLGLEFTNTAKTYGLLLASTKGVNISFAETQEIFKGFATASRALQLSADDVGGVFRALGQILSKGKLQAEELRGQLGDRLPGAFVRFAAALDMTKPGELDQALKKGAISGDKLKNAIIEVARTLESDYAQAADKASKTVDSAFNRLKNAFTFESAELGTNGLNMALIALFDTTRKFIQSDAFNTFLTGLASVLKFVGDNVETLATLIGSALIAKFALASASVLSTTSVFLTFGKAIQAIGWAAVAAGMGNVRAAAIALFGVIRAHPFFFLTAAIAAAIGVLSLLKKATNESTKAMNDQAGASAYGANLASYYASRIDQGTSSINAQTQALRNNTIEKLRNAAAGSGLVGDDAPFKARLGRGSVVRDINGKKRTITKDGYTYSVDTEKGYVRLTGGNASIVNSAITSGQNIRSGADYRRFIESTGTLGALIESNQNLSTSTRLRNQYNDNIRRIQTLGGPGANKEFQQIFAASQKQVSGPDNVPLITGDVSPSGGGGGKKGKGDSSYQNALDRMINSFKELKDAAGVAADQVAKALGGGNIQDIEAAAAAQDALNQMKSSFDSQGEYEKAIVSTAQSLGLEAKGYEEARAALAEYYKQKELSKKQAETDFNVLSSIDDLKKENQLRAKLVDSALEGNEALSRAEALLEYEKELTNGTAENRDAILQKAKAELRVQQDINSAIDAAGRLADYRDQGKKYQAYAGLYSQGYNSSDLEEAKKLIDLRAELEKKYGANRTDLIQPILDAEKATYRLATADKRLQDEMQKNIELGVDFADAIVDGFKEAIDSGGTFLDAMKNIFKNLKNIILEFVLYNPLRDFLQQSLSAAFQQNIGTSGSAKGALTTAVAGTNNAYGNGASFFTSLFSNISSGGSSPSGAASSLRSGASNLLKNAFSDAIIVSAPKTAVYQADATLEAQKKGGFFAPLKQVFDYKSNALNDGTLKKLSQVLGSGNSKLGDKIGAIGDAVGAVAGTAVKAFAAYELGSGVAGALGIGKVGKGIFGGAAAGFSIGGPIGAGIGAILGGIGGFLKKTPAAYANVSVGENGQIGISKSGKRGKGDLTAAQNAANNGIRVFQDFADQFEATLNVGSYGTFGNRKGKNYYSTVGSGKKGKPLGVKGVDYIYGTDSELQAFALKKQIQAGKFAGLDPIYQTISRTSGSNTIEGFQQDLSIGKAYLDFIDQAIPKSDIQKNVSNLQKSFTLLSAKSKSLGLDTAKLARAYDLMKKTIKDDFNYAINQELLSFTDPLMGQWNDLVKEYEQTVADGVAAGGDLVAVEELYGKKREELLKQFLESGVNAVKQAGKDMLFQLTATSSSPLSAGTVFNNAQGAYNNLVGQFASGDYTNADKLNEIVSSYLDAARNIFGSNSQFYDIFSQVTGFLGSDSSYGVGTGNGTTDASNLPELPALQDVLDKLEEQKNALVESNVNLGNAILEGNADISELLKNILNRMGTGSSGSLSYGGGGGIRDILQNGVRLL